MSAAPSIIFRLKSGQITTEQAADELAQAVLPVSPKATMDEALAGADPEPMTPGSFAEVEDAYVAGDITPEQYAALARAAARGAKR